MADKIFKGLRGLGKLPRWETLPASEDSMLVEKILARPFENLSAQAADHLIQELEEVRWALTTVQALADEDDSGLLSQRFSKWRGLVDERRACMAALYPDAPSAAHSG